MENRTITTIPAAVLEHFDSLTWEDTTETALVGFTTTGVEVSPGSGIITLYGLYPLQGSNTYLIMIYADDTPDATNIPHFQRAAV